MSFLRRIISFCFMIVFTYFVLENVPELQTRENISEISKTTNLDCMAFINQTIQLLKQKNISRTCSLLKPSACDWTHDRLKLYATPVSVYSRASACESLELPNKTAVFDKEEEDYPLAFSILTYGDPRHFELLIKKIFRPFNLYCIHVDPRSDEMFKATINLILECYSNKFSLKNIFTVEDPIPIFWGHMSMLEADMLCMKALLNKSSSWKAMVNFAGSEFPRFPNLEFVKRTKLSKSGYVRSVPMRQGTYNYRLRFTWELINTKFNPDRSSKSKPVKRTFKEKSKPPFGLKIYTGVRSFILPRFWVWFLMVHPVSKTYIDWSRDSYMPEEHVVHTITRISKVMFINKQWVIVQDKDDRSNNGVRKTMWNYQKDQKCHGVWRNWICVLTMKDLPFILDPLTEELIINKFQSKIDPLVVPCLEEIIP